MSNDLGFFQMTCLVGLLVGSFVLGRLSHHISIPICCRRIKNENFGKYSKHFYPNGTIQHTKLVLCARKDIKMGNGKLAAQCSHATLGVVKLIENNNDGLLLEIWRSYGQPKIVTAVQSLQELQEIQQNADKNNIPAYVVCDAGKTQVPSGTYTVLAVGPAPDNIVDRVTGHLKLM